MKVGMYVGGAAFACMLLLCALAAVVHGSSMTSSALLTSAIAGVAFGAYAGTLRTAIGYVDRACASGGSVRRLRRAGLRAVALAISVTGAVVCTVIALQGAPRGAATVFWAVIMTSSTLLAVRAAVSRRQRWLSTYRPPELEDGERLVTASYAWRTPRGIHLRSDGTLSLTTRRLVFTSEKPAVTVELASVTRVVIRGVVLPKLVIESAGGWFDVSVGMPEAWVSHLSRAAVSA